MDFSTILNQKRELIIEKWIKEVFKDNQIEATQELTFKAVRNSLPEVLESLAAMLADDQQETFQTIDQASLKHGIIRAEQGFEPTEIAREYRLLRSVIFSELETDLVHAPPKDILRATRLIDTVIDEAIAHCFDSYTQSRIEEFKSLKTQLQLTNQELTRLVRASQNDIAQLTHELKTPLTSIIGYADFFLKRQKQQSSETSDIHTESIERVLRSGRLLLQLINNTLELQQGDRRVRLNITSADPKQTIQSVIEIIEPLVRKKGLELNVECDRAPQQIQTDPLRLQQILTNLLSNAIRYTDSGYITIIANTSEPQHWSIVIRDSGIGIHPDDQKHIFEPYFRTRNATLPKDEQGTGLGLAIVAQLVELMQGKILVSSEVGQGSTFTVTFPIDYPAET
ncbi:sensor histidine kinase [Oscillatoria sp. CS-180]|uniref:sensor histidine kinase n=1 Tax=Oscillatoria sp. CS-180 TaxID=3021720 RepID=UPI00232DDFB8|nr:sensor histidine kinase [Oscillatoria sp. CS-180]MDB9528551.1 sensor histidine kinase [Oscillatoria sp. CS-180]